MKALHFLGAIQLRDGLSLNEMIKRQNSDEILDESEEDLEDDNKYLGLLGTMGEITPMNSNFKGFSDVVDAKMKEKEQNEIKKMFGKFRKKPRKKSRNKTPREENQNFINRIIKQIKIGKAKQQERAEKLHIAFDKFIRSNNSKKIKWKDRDHFEG